jgi:hypothetical protein
MAGERSSWGGQITEVMRRRSGRILPIVASLALVSACAEGGVSVGASPSPSDKVAASPSSASESPYVRTAPSPSVSAAGQVIRFKFDNLGSTYPGGQSIRVSKGPRDTPEDRTVTGTYNNHDVVDALCLWAHGRGGRVRQPDPAYSESSGPEKKYFDEWVKINGSPSQYASFTYGELIPKDAVLPPCPDLP